MARHLPVRPAEMKTAGRVSGHRLGPWPQILVALSLLTAAQSSMAQEHPHVIEQEQVEENNHVSPLRLATWNIRWFPRGCPDVADCPDAATDLDLVAKTIAFNGLDLVALQEIIYDETGRDAMSQLVHSLDSLTDGTWLVDVQTCGAPESMRVGFLWNGARLTLSNFADLEQLNGASEDGGGACAENLRPGRYAYVRSEDGRLDFHVITVHFDSGRRHRDYQNRRDAARQIPYLKLGESELRRLDADVIILGDFNTMGRGEFSEITAETEFEAFDNEIGSTYRRISIAQGCSEYYRGRGSTLDFFVLSESLASTPLVSEVAGYCADNACRDLDEDNMPHEYQRLSDHCPVILELDHADL